MPRPERVTASAGELVRGFVHDSDLARSQPVVITRDGKPCNVPISVEESERLKQHVRHAFPAVDTPEEFLAEIERLAEPGT